MRKSCIALTVLMCMLTGCGHKDAPPSATKSGSAGPSGASGASGSATAPSNSAAPAPAPADEDLAAFSSGALVVQEPDPESEHSAAWLLRGPYGLSYNWEVSGAPGSQAAVIELPERSLIKQVEFDTAMVTGDGAAKDVTVEVSDTSAKAGFSQIAEASLQKRVDGQTFPASAGTPGRWIRLGIRSGYGTDWAGINRFRARGTRLSSTPPPNVSGTYSTPNGKMHIRQEGTSVVGCYDYQQGTMEGGIEGRVVKLTWHEKAAGANEGASFLVFSDDTQRWVGLFSYKGEDPNDGRFWAGKKQNSAVGACPNWAGGIEQAMAKDIEEFGRARVYGINFDSDSDRIRDESRQTLDHIAAMLKARPQWNITIEGHTDSTATAGHNQELSERRAGAVRHYLEGTVDVARLKAVGYGDTKPVAPNDTTLGRAQNRRVELVKQ